MQTVLVTGASGFVGSTLLRMAAQGAFGGEQRFVALPDSVDLRQPAQLNAAFAQANHDAVIHLAAISFVPESFQRPIDTYEINLHGTINLIEWLRARGFRSVFLYVSSGDVYGSVPSEALPIMEERVARPARPNLEGLAARDALVKEIRERWTAGQRTMASGRRTTIHGRPAAARSVSIAS